MLDTVDPTGSVYIFLYDYTFLLLAKHNWFTSNMGKLSCISWYDDDDGNDDDDDDGNDDDDEWWWK